MAATAEWVEVEQRVVERPAPEPSPPVVERAAEAGPGKSRMNARVFVMTAVIVCVLAAGWYWKVQADAARVAKETRQATAVASARIAEAKQKAAIAETVPQAEAARQTEPARQAEATRQAEAARLGSANKQAALEARAAERQKILDGNDTGALRDLATKGDTDAAVNLGLIFETGRSVIQDYGEARKWYVQAALAKNAWGQMSLGLDVQTRPWS